MIKLFKKKHKKTDKQMRKRILKLCKDGDYGIFSPPMDAQVAVNELCRYLLGDDWYCVNPLCSEQINTEIVYEIEKQYKNKRG